MAEPMVPAAVKRLLTRLAGRQLRAFDALHLRHAGQRCYIFGNGISLKWMDLRAFADRPAITTAEVTYLHDARYLDLRYGSMTEPFIFYPWFRYPGLGLVRNRLHLDALASMRRYQDARFFVNLSNRPVVHADNVIFVSRWHRPAGLDRNPFAHYHDAHRGTLAFQLCLAIYLGFSEAHLIGHDYTHVPARLRHFYEKGQGDPGGEMPIHADLLRYARQYLNLTTVTLDTERGQLPAVTYASLTGLQPQFRENTALLDHATLKNLATGSPHYRVW